MFNERMTEEELEELREAKIKKKAWNNPVKPPGETAD